MTRDIIVIGAGSRGGFGSIDQIFSTVDEKIKSVMGTPTKFGIEADFHRVHGGLDNCESDPDSWRREHRTNKKLQNQPFYFRGRTGKMRGW